MNLGFAVAVLRIFEQWIILMLNETFEWSKRRGKNLVVLAHLESRGIRSERNIAF